MSAKLRNTVVVLAAAVIAGCEAVAGIQDLTYAPGGPDGDSGNTLPDGSNGSPDSTTGNDGGPSRPDATVDADASPGNVGEAGGEAASDARDGGPADVTVPDSPADSPGSETRPETGPTPESGTGQETGGGGGPDAGDSGVTGPFIPGPDGGPLHGTDGGILYGSLVDDFDSEIQPGNIPGNALRRGSWYTFSDGTAGGIVPAAGGAPSAIVQVMTSRAGVTTNRAGHMTGNGAAAYAGMGCNLNALGALVSTYDASAYQGVTFWARIGPTTGTEMLQFNMPDRNTSNMGDGGCTACGASFTTQLLSVSPTWQQYVIYFNQLSEPSFGVPQEPSVAAGALFSAQFQMIAGAAFDIWIDDIYFISK